MHRFCLPLVALMVLSSCGENQVAVKTQSARQDFLQAVELVQLVQVVYTPTAKRKDRLEAMNQYQSFGLDSLPADAKAAITGAKTYDEYRAAVLKAASDKLKTLTNQGVTSQQVAASHLLAQVETLQSSVLRRDAIEASDQLATEVTVLVASIANVERALAMAKPYNLDDSAIVSKLGDDKTAVDEKVTNLQGEVTTLSGELTTLNQQIMLAESKRDDAFKKASGLRAQAFTKKGQEQYDLHIAAIKADREGYEADKQAADAKVARDLVAARLAIAQADLKMFEDWSKGIQNAMGDAGTRKAVLANVQNSVTKQVGDTIKGRFLPAFNALAKQYKEKIEAPIDSAIAHAGEAVTLATAAEQKAPSQTKVEAKMWLMDANVEKLSALADGMITTSAFANTLNHVLSRGGAILGDNATALQDLVAALETKNAAYHTQALAAVSAVKTAYGDPLLTGISGEKPLDVARTTRIRTVKSLIASIEPKLAQHRIGAASAE